ncbi:MAG: hypothetical protein GY913_36305 [Proteobacteria bacterium]|nr:hypothetical protein [Pseudomonadota bacterium]
MTARDGTQRPLSEEYESLRQAVLAAPARRPPGVTGVQMQGLWAWVQVADMRRGQGSPASSRPRLPPPELQARLIDVWVQVALAHASET